jgi:hypothetical protein
LADEASDRIEWAVDQRINRRSGADDVAVEIVDGPTARRTERL